MSEARLFEKSSPSCTRFAIERPGQTMTRDSKYYLIRRRRTLRVTSSVMAVEFEMQEGFNVTKTAKNIETALYSWIGDDHNMRVLEYKE